jgi:hypothetical protein
MYFNSLYLKSNQRFFKQPQQGSGKRQLLRHDGTLRKTYGSNNVSAKEPIGLLVTKDFDHTVGLADSLCAAVGDEGELADVVFDALYKKRWLYVNQKLNLPDVKLKRLRVF